MTEEVDMQTMMLMDQPSNPFYVSSNFSTLKYAKTSDIYAKYTDVKVLCLVDNFEASVQAKNRVKLFYNKDSQVDELVGQKEFIVLTKMPIEIIHNFNIRSGLVAVGKQHLEPFNTNELVLANEELVYLMLETKESTIESWKAIHFTSYSFDDFLHQKIFTDYYELTNPLQTRETLAMLSKIDEFNYWHNPRHCLLSINNAFVNRKFNLKLSAKWNLSHDEIETELHKLLTNFKKEKAKHVGNGSSYNRNLIEPEEPTINLVPNKTDFDDIKDNVEVPIHGYVTGAFRDNKMFYSAVTDSEMKISRALIEELLTSSVITDQEKYHLICKILSSKQYCHYVINNRKIMEANSELLARMKPVLRYILGYSWVTLYMEESIRKSKIRQSDHYVFDLETASQLPVYPFSVASPHTNPYFSVLISDENINLPKNILSMVSNEDYQKGIVDLPEFRRRLNLFVSEDAGFDLFEGVDWQHMVITGGTMATILPRSNPLFAVHAADRTNPTDEEWKTIFRTYHANSDIDVACNHLNIVDFIDHMHHVKSVLHTNTMKKIPNAQLDDFTITPCKTLSIFINDNVLRHLCKRGEIPFSYEQVINGKTDPEIKFYFYQMYIKEKNLSNATNQKIIGSKIRDPLYFSIIDYCTYDSSVIVVNNFSSNEVIDFRLPENNSGIAMQNSITADDYDSESENPGDIFIKFNETLKFKINSCHMVHPIELFRINSVEFFNCIGRFHLPCVRSYYNGTTCYMLPSAITAYHTHINTEFKYFIGSHDPISIIDKYKRRGYGVILNKNEIAQYKSYHIVKNRATKKDQTEIKTGYLKPNDPFFVNQHILAYHDTKVKTCQEYMENIDTMNPEYPWQFNKINAIDSNGQVEPFKSWMVDAAWEMIKKK